MAKRKEVAGQKTQEILAVQSLFEDAMEKLHTARQFIGDYSGEITAKMLNERHYQNFTVAYWSFVDEFTQLTSSESRKYHLKLNSLLESTAKRCTPLAERTKRSSVFVKKHYLN